MSVRMRKRRKQIAATQATVDPTFSLEANAIAKGIPTDSAEDITADATAPVLDFSKDILTPPIKPAPTTPTTPVPKKRGSKGNTAKLPQ